MIEIYNDALTNDELIYLKKECDSFTITSQPYTSVDKKSYNFYVRNSLNKKNEFSFYKKILNNNDINYKIEGIWLNKVNIETNKNDDYHTDVCDLSIVIFLNDDFEGGEFEYMDNFGKSNKIKPEKNKAIVMDKKLPHRVLPVISGERFTLVCFLEHIKKQTKSLI